MGAIVTGRDYTNQYRPEIVDWLLGNTGDWQRLSITCRFGVEATISNSSGVGLLVGNIVKREDGKNWSDFGFDLGDTIYMTIPIEGEYTDSSGSTNTLTGNISWNGRTITLLQGDEMTLSGSDITAPIPLPIWDLDTTGSFDRIPFQSGKIKTAKTAIIYADKKPQGIELVYGHLENADADSANLNSFIDGTLTRAIALNTHTLTGYQLMELVDLQSGMAIEEAVWVYWGKIGTHFYQYNINITFMLASFFEDLSNFENNEAPSEVFDSASLTDNFILTGYPEWNNPNTKIKSDTKKTKRLGNTGWFDENFNGLDNDFTIISVEYFDVMTGAQTDRLSYGSDTRVKVRVGGIQNMANGLSKYGLGFAWLPEDEEYYKELDTPFHKNLMMNTCGGFNTGVHSQSNIINPTTYAGWYTDPSRRMDVRNVRFMQSGADLIYEAVFSPTAGFKNFIDALDEVDRNYLLWISVGDRTLVTNFSNRVSLKLDYNKMNLFIPPVGEWDTMTTVFYEHPEDGTGSATAQCGYDFFVEDDLLAKSDFTLDINEPIPNAIEFAIEMENLVTGAKINLQSYRIDLTAFPTDGMGVPQWDYDDIRGFKLETGNNKNWVKVKRNPTLDTGSNYGYTAYYAFKLRWEDWIPRTGVSGDFFDAMALNNGFNNDWFQYLGTANWQMNYTVYLESTLDGQAVRYVNSEVLNFKDYNSNIGLTKQWNFYRESDGTLLNAGIDIVTGEPLGVLLSNEQVRVEVIYTRGIGTWASLADVYGTLCIEVDQGAGQMEFRQLSSFWGSESDNPLIPVAGATNAHLTLVAPNQIKIECLVEPSLLLEANRYKHTSRLGCLTS